MRMLAIFRWNRLLHRAASATVTCVPFPNHLCEDVEHPVHVSGGDLMELKRLLELEAGIREPDEFRGMYRLVLHSADGSALADVLLRTPNRLWAASAPWVGDHRLAHGYALKDWLHTAHAAVEPRHFP